MTHLLLALIALATALAQPAAPLVQSVDLAVPVGPGFFLQGNTMQLVYELHVTNFQAADVSLVGVTVRDANSVVLASYSGTELQQRITRPGLRHDHATPRILGPGMRAVVNLWIAMPSASGMRSISHEVDLEVARPAGPARVTVRGGMASTSYSPAVELDAPLRGGPWIAIYDPLLKGGHRTAIYTLEGRARIPGRYAIDFISLPQSGALPAVRAADANGFGAEVLAVADGTVTIAVDGVTDATPPPVSLEQAAGNHVAIDLGGGRFAFYEHLQLGSVAVKAGARVTRGQVIARLGSSGSSSIGPHLHFHVSDAGATLTAEGMPFVFRQFTDIGRFASITALLSGEKWLPGGVATIRQRERPEPMTVVHFPQ